MLPIIWKIPSLIFFWTIGIVFSIAYYVSLSKKYLQKWYISLLLGLVMIILETFAAKIMFFIENPLSIKNGISWKGGYSLFGVFFFCPVFLLILSWLLKIRYLHLMDFLIPGILIELSFYRIGCMCAGCCYGIEVGWGITNGTTSGLFPVQPLEAILDLSAFLLIHFLLMKNKLKTGEPFYITYLSYGIIRFTMEFLRHRTNVIGPFSTSHFYALAIFIFGLGMIIYSRFFKKDSSNEETKASI